MTPVCDPRSLRFSSCPGYAAYLGRTSKRDCALVSMLISAGAVLHCRTNVPQTMMVRNHFLPLSVSYQADWLVVWPMQISDTLNHVFGRTRNPLNRSLTPGGSSGGEGALIRMKGSILGVGTDIGGSIRIPSSFCGLCGLRPTTRRVPYGFATNSMVSSSSIRFLGLIRLTRWLVCSSAKKPSRQSLVLWLALSARAPTSSSRSSTPTRPNTTPTLSPLPSTPRRTIRHARAKSSSLA